MPIRLHHVVIPLVVGGLAAGSATGLLWAVTTLEGKWLIAALLMLFFSWLALIIRDLESCFLGLFVLFLSINPDVYFSVGGVMRLGLSAGDLALLGLYVLWIVRLVGSPHTGQRVAIPPSLGLPLGLLTFWSLLATVKTGAIPTLHQLIRFLKVWLVVFYCVNNLNKESKLRLISVGLCLGILVESALVYVQYVLGTPLGLDVLGESRHSLVSQEIGSADLIRVGGTRGHPNALAAFLVPILSVIAALWLGGKSFWTRALAAMTFLVGLVSLVLTFSRGGWVSFGLVAPCVLALGAWKTGGAQRAFGALVGLGLLAALVLLPFSDLIRQRLVEHDYGRAWSRVPQLYVAANIVKEHPIMGVGLGGYRRVMADYDYTLERISLNTQHPVHNMFFLIAAEAGLPALGFLLWLIVVLLRRGWEGFRHGEGFESLVCLGLLGGLSSYLIHGLVEFRYLQASYLFPFLMGLVGALSLWKPNPARA